MKNLGNDKLAADGLHINGAVKGDRQPGLQVEAIERIDDVQFFAIEGARLAIGPGQVNA